MFVAHFREFRASSSSNYYDPEVCAVHIFMPDLGLFPKYFYPVLVVKIRRVFEHQSLANQIAAAFQQYGVAPNSIHIANALTPSYFTKATRFVKRDAGKVFRENARL
jgi:hypothetical protein